jgi:hypothetical protein
VKRLVKRVLTRPVASHLPVTAHIPVTIVDKEHPHYGENGVLTGEVIQFKFWKGEMAFVKLDACVHGMEACYVSKGQVRERASA